MSCFYSRRGHTWRELGAVPDATGIIDHARRVCAKCGAHGHVDKQGRVISGDEPTADEIRARLEYCNRAMHCGA